VNDERDERHQQVADLLRTSGRAKAPPDLAPSVMGEIRRERAQARRGRLLASGSRWALAAAALLAIGFGISRLGTGGASSSGSAPHEAAASAGAGSGANGLGVVKSTADSRTYYLPAADAKRALGLPASGTPYDRLTQLANGTRVTVRGSTVIIHAGGKSFNVVAAHLDAVAREQAGRTQSGPAVTIVLRRR
jgi:hypothetical protein